MTYRAGNRIVPDDKCPPPAPTAGRLPHRLRDALALLIETGQETMIDLGAMPPEEADEARLWEILGSGEVRASIESLGTTLIRETAIAGVWVVEHLSGARSPVGRFVEVTFVPSLLRTQREDAVDGLRTLEARLSD